MSNVMVDGVQVPIEGESNLLEIVRKSGTDLPTFCYQPGVSVFGSCRMCIVDVKGRGILPACSTKPEDGMVVKTATTQILNMRRMIVELMLASHDKSCLTCPKNGECKLQSVAKQLGVNDIRFAQQEKKDMTVDETSHAIRRDPAKCILCGDCVRTCSEIQTVGALDFAYRGADAQVVTPFNKGMGGVECVNCGQCAKVCPVGALTIRNHIDEVWKDLHDDEKTVVVQIAPAVRVALGEYFGEAPGVVTIEKTITALRRLGFDKVFDTSFGADLTVVEEGREFITRYTKGGTLPMFTSCCPAWVKFAEQYYPDMLPNLSTCKSPQGMFGALCKNQLPKELGVSRDKVVVVSVMPCTAKKAEVKREELAVENNPDVDHVITTHELALMIKRIGLDFNNLQKGEFDKPFGAFTGAGVIFGASGGVSEAVLRFAANELEKGTEKEFTQLRGEDGTKTAEIEIGGNKLRLAVVSGLANARKLVERVKEGKEQYDLIEVMACCGGCVNGGGQPVNEHHHAVDMRSKGLFNNDKEQKYHESSANPDLVKTYEELLDEHLAHDLFHTSYTDRSETMRKWD